jgi:hypothetical protein
MSQSQPHNSDTDEDEQTLINRRSVLRALAAGVGATVLGALVDGDSPAPEEISLGGNSRESLAAGHRYGGVSVAPQTIPPTGDRLTWFFNDDLGVGEARAPDSLPATWTANGIEWVAASDLEAAESQRTSVPAILFGFSDPAGEKVTAELVAPDDNRRWTANGIEIVIDASLGGARSRHSGATPAVLFGADGTGEVVVA